MTVPPVEYHDDALDPLLLERQRRRYASRAIAYLVLLNGVAALILLANLSRLAAQVPEPRMLVDAMLVFGIGAAIALGSTFFATCAERLDCRFRSVFRYASVCGGCRL